MIEGSVQRAGDKVKIPARLSNASDSFQVRTDSFTRDAKDVFAVEEEIAGPMAKHLSLKLGQPAPPRRRRALIRRHSYSRCQLGRGGISGPSGWLARTGRC